MLSEEDFSNFIKKLEEIIKQLFSDTRMIQKPQLYKYMGFTENWLDIKAIVLKSRLGYLFLSQFQYIFSYLGYKMTKFIDLVKHDLVKCRG